MTRALVVEDSPTQSEELRLILESEGFEVQVAPNGRVGLEALRSSGPFDIVLSDIVMPGMSGYELCRAAKSHSSTRDIPVILLTSLSDPMDVIQGLECGADNFVTKPYDAAYLVARVNGILENRRLRSEGRLRVGVEVMFLGRTFTITSDKEQILDLLIATFEDTVRKNRELEASQGHLAAALAKLEVAHKELETFSYSVSHDLRAPLRRVDAFAQILLDDYAPSLDAQGQDYLRKVRAGTQRMGELIDDLLKLARASRVALQPSEVDVSRLVQTVVANLHLAEPARDVEVVQATLPPCYADARLVRVVLENLLGNAWKFTSKVEHPRVEVGASPLPGGEVHYYVRDNGAGFDMQYVEQLFTPFQRLHAEADFPGTGVGLATVRGIVQRHRGRIWAEAAPGAGATFHFTLPAAPAQGH